MDNKHLVKTGERNKGARWHGAPLSVPKMDDGCKDLPTGFEVSLGDHITTVSAQAIGFALASSTLTTQSGFGTNEDDYSDELPADPGRVVIRYKDSEKEVIDLRWGTYGEVGSILATFVR